jgi:hypothetical protein
MIVRLLLLAWPLLAIEPAADIDGQILAIRRIHVERLTGGDTAGQLRDMIIAALQRTGNYVLTENPDRADAYLRGSAEDLVFTDVFQTSDGIQMRSSMGLGTGSYSARSNGRTSVSASASLGENESTRIAERKHEAVASVRLVGKSGDILWSATKESQGAKFKGASADVADKITRQLLEDLAMIRKKRATAN